MRYGGARIQLCPFFGLHACENSYAQRSALCYSGPTMQRLFLLPLTALAFLLAAHATSAQKFQPKTIQFKGAPEYSDQELLAAAGLKKGATLTVDEMKGHFQQLMDTGVFENVLYKFDGIDLVYSLKPATNMYPIQFENLPLTPGKDMDAKLHDRFPLYHGKVPSEGGLLESVRGAVEEMLAAQGVKATIMATPFTDQKLRQVTAISFFITTPPVEVGEIHFDAAALTDPKAQEILSKQTGSPYDRAGSPNQIATNLGNYYRDKGNLEVDVQASPQFPAAASADAIQVPFKVSVSTGPLYRIQSIQLAPDMVVSQADFDRQSHIHPGDVADRARVLENWEFLARQYHNKGYMKAEVHPLPSFDRAKGTVTFAVTADPGQVYNMGTLKIENVGDDIRTLMLAAWKMPVGSVFNEGAVRGFYAIGDRNPTLNRLFAAVNCKYTLTLNDDTHTVDVVLRLEKRP